MLFIEPTADCVILSVKVQPGARRNSVTGVHDQSLKISVTQAPEKGKATAAVIDVLAEAIGLKPNQIELISGQTSRQKRFQIRLNEAELRKRLAQLLQELGLTDDE